MFNSAYSFLCFREVEFVGSDLSLLQFVSLSMRAVC